ncbi:MAG: nucleotidyltransferase domain-containing protein [Candidatus Aenigmarchaeota archaeon]|nr:nucleotidyltransferase domain-containing protein [Candidatus Aenigmarchaeota archaeon]
MKSLYPYIYDFLSVLAENKKLLQQIKNIILFGSVASGESDEESDIDLFIEIKNKKNLKPVEKDIEKVKKTFYSIAERKWALMEIKNPISCTVGVLEDWKSLKVDIISNGIHLYGKYEKLPKKLNHYALFTYSLIKLKQKNKMKILRKLFGYKLKKGRREYKQTGFIEDIGGKKVGKNSLLVPVEESKKLRDLLNSFKITPEIREVWMR